MARKGDISVVMWLVIGLLLLLAVIGVVIVLNTKGQGVIQTIKDALSGLS